MKLVFLDRDGVINRDRVNYVLNWSEWVWLDGVKEAMADLKRAGWTMIVISNQSCIGKGIIGADKIEAVNDRMLKELAEAGAEPDGVYICPHAPDAGCDCRKPLPGLINRAAQEMDLDISEAWLVGDAERDIQAAQAVGIKTILVRTGKGKEVEGDGKVRPDLILDDLSAAAAYLLG